MKKILITFFAALAVAIIPQIGFAATTLSVGDLVIITANATGTYPSTNGFDFVSRVDLDTGTVINFTDKGWDGSLGTPFWRNTLAEGVVRFTVPASIPAGTIVHFDDSLIASSPGTWDMFSIDPITGAFGLASGANVMDFATTGDNLLVFQGTGAAPAFIYGVGWAGATTWISSGTPTSNNSWVPVPLTLGTNAISLGSPDNFQYSCGVSGLFSSGFLASLANSTNWVNNTTPYSTSTCTFDVTQPTVTINQSVGQVDPTNNSALSFTVVFSEAINPVTFTAGDVVLSGTGTGTVGTPTTSDNITWTVPVTATSNGTIIASLAASTVTDVNGDPNLVATSTDASVTYDTTAPTISEVTAVTSPTNDATPDYTFTTDEAGTIIYGGSCSSATTTAIVGNNTITLNSLSEGTYGSCTITVTDAAGNTSSALTLSSFTIDTTIPVITITNPTVTPASSKTVTASTNEGTLTMAINPAGSTTCDGTLTFVAYSSTTFTVESDNTRTICYRAVDAAGNTTYTVSSVINGIDTTAPTIILSTVAPVTVTGLFTITLTPSESVSELTLSDISVTNGTASNLTGSGVGPYTVDITPTSNGSLTVSVPFGVSPTGIVDAAGNRQNSHSNTITRTVVFIPSAPTVTIASTSATAGTVSGICEAGATVTLASAALAPNPTTIICTIGGTYTTPIIVSANPITISVTQTNAGGTSSAVIGNFNYVAPVVPTGNAAVLIPSVPIQNSNSIITSDSNTISFISPIDNSPRQCPAFSKYLKLYSSANDRTEVKMWQSFLNKNFQEKLPVTGFYGPLTFEAIKRFQLKYKNEILTPWGLKNPTGYTYQTTRHTANKLLGCSEGLLSLDNGVTIK